MNSRHLTIWLLAVTPAMLMSRSACAFTFLGSNANGQIISIDSVTGAGTFIGNDDRFSFGVELEYDPSTGKLYAEENRVGPNLHTINPATGLSTGLIAHAEDPLIDGLEFVGPTLYTVTNFFEEFGGVFWSLATLDVTTGQVHRIGQPHEAFSIHDHVRGLAYDTSTDSMYAVRPSVRFGWELITIDIASGAFARGPQLLDAAGQEPGAFGSLEFGPDGELYSVLTCGQCSSSLLVTIDPTTGLVDEIGPTGFQALMGLTVPEPSWLGLVFISIAWRLRRAAAGIV